MIQLPDTQLQVSLRALQEVVAPALKDSESHVVEQLQLVIATLGFARQRLPHMRSYYRRELDNYIHYGRDVSNLIEASDVPLAEQLSTQAQAGADLLQNPESDIEDYLIISRQLRELIASAVERAAGTDIEAGLNQLVIEKLRQILPHQRAWYTPFGLDPTPEALPTLE